jgi:hypothetical protein
MKKEFHGKAIQIQPISSSGWHLEPEFGTGDISLNTRLVVDGQVDNGHSIDIGKIEFTQPTTEQRLNADTTPFFTKEGINACNVNRRLSKIQAEYITALICKALNEEFNGVIPSDDEIKQLVGGRK